VGTHQAPYRICGSEHRAGRHGVEPKGSVPVRQRRGVAAWRPDRVGHEALYGYDTRGRTGPLARECSVHCTMRSSDAILESV
jgi:hypothetical protein